MSTAERLLRQYFPRQCRPRNVSLGNIYLGNAPIVDPIGGFSHAKLRACTGAPCAISGCYAVAVKVIPSNQTLILASERRAAGDQATRPLAQALSSAANASVLKRVTIVAAQPDSAFVYLRADYEETGTVALANFPTPSLPEQPLEGQSTAVLAPRPLSKALRDAFGNARTTSHDAAPSAYVRPAEQYARTQRILAESPPPKLIDVRA